MDKIKIEKLFVIIGLVVGSILIYIIPPFQSPDEDSHFKKAYSISEGNLYKIKNNEITGLLLPDSMDSYISIKLKMSGDLKQKYTYDNSYFDTFLASDFSDTHVYNVSTEDTTPIAHIVPAIGILLSKVVGKAMINGPVSTTFMLQFARFFSLIAYLAIGYFAIKITPNFKKSMFTILLLPMSIFLGSMVSYDSILISISILVISLILRLIYDKKVVFSKNNFILFTIIGYILLNIKIVYFPILLLLLFVPGGKFKDENIRSKIITLIKLIFIILLFTILLKIPNLLINESESTSLMGDQLSFIVNHPLKYIYILLLNIKSQFYSQMYWMIGTFGLLDTYLPPLFAVMSLTNLILVFLMDAINEKINVSVKQKIIILCIFIFAVSAIYTAMYIYWTPNVLGITGGNIITGVQGRYFIPLLILLPILCSNKLLKNKKKIVSFTNNYFDKSVLVTCICLVISIIVCITRYWN